MAKNIFVNLPVKDLDRSMAFFTRLGFTFNPAFTNDRGASLIIGDHIYAMLLTEDHFKEFTVKEIADTSKFASVILAIDVDSRPEVDELVNKAIAAGATEPMEAKDHGFMFQRGFQDPDGHLWEILYIDQTQVPA